MQSTNINQICLYAAYVLWCIQAPCSHICKSFNSAEADTNLLTPKGWKAQLAWINANEQLTEGYYASQKWYCQDLNRWLANPEMDTSTTQQLRLTVLCDIIVEVLYLVTYSLTYLQFTSLVSFEDGLWNLTKYVVVAHRRTERSRRMLQKVMQLMKLVIVNLIQCHIQWQHLAVRTCA